MKTLPGLLDEVRWMLEELVIHLNDWHSWSTLRIAAALERGQGRRGREG